MQYPTETQNHPAYKCGRLLAVIERIQSAAIGNPNATLTDRYYGSASTTPASVFGVLLRMTQPHLSKLRKQSARAGNRPRTRPARRHARPLPHHA
jgi:CRISPR-associated protein Csd1